MADLESEAVIEAATVFNIASVSKQFTAFAILIAEALGLLRRDDHLVSYVPELASIAPDVTLRQLLHHTSGLPDYIGLLFERGRTIHEVTTPADALAVLASTTGADTPGACFDYSNSGYFLLALCIERTAGQSLAEFSARQIFGPLGMTDTRIVDAYPVTFERFAHGYRPDGTGAHVPCESPWQQTGDGQVHTTILDLARWDAQLRDGLIGGLGLRDALVAPGRLVTGASVPYAAGLALETWAKYPAIGHEGGWAGYRANYLRLPEQDLAVAVLANDAGFDPVSMSKNLLARYV